jgi:short-subunit dehydrogenase
VTGASRGMGLELARPCAQNHYDLIIAADDVSVLDVAQELASSGVAVSPVICDLSTLQGVDALGNAIAASGKPADILIAMPRATFPSAICIGCSRMRAPMSMERFT